VAILSKHKKIIEKIFVYSCKLETFIYLCGMKSIMDLKTVKHYAQENNVTTAYIYKLMKEKKLAVVLIDGVMFVDTSVNPKIKPN
jgi:hypothetical protein